MLGKGMSNIINYLVKFYGNLGIVFLDIFGIMLNFILFFCCFIFFGVLVGLVLFGRFCGLDCLGELGVLGGF